MSVWQKHFNAPLSLYHLDRGADECKTAMANYYSIEAQRKVMGVK